MSHRLTHAFATTLHRADLRDYEPTADAIDTLTEDFSDERKADLYALIQEAVSADMTFEALSSAIDHCLTTNEARFIRA